MSFHNMSLALRHKFIHSIYEELLTNTQYDSKQAWQNKEQEVWQWLDGHFVLQKHKASLSELR